MKDRILELAGLNEAASMKMQVNVELTPQLFDQIRRDNYLARDMRDEEIATEIRRFLDELKTPHGLSLVLENLDYFNY